MQCNTLSEPTRAQHHQPVVSLADACSAPRCSSLSSDLLLLHPLLAVDQTAALLGTRVTTSLLLRLEQDLRRFAAGGIQAGAGALGAFQRLALVAADQQNGRDEQDRRNELKVAPN